MSTSSSNTKLTEDAGVLERYLKLTEKCRKRAQQMTVAPSPSTSPKFNFEQCKYLADKLKLAVESARSFLVLLKREYFWFSSPEGMGKCLESFKLLYALSKEVESFTQDCCNDASLLAALTLTNVSEHISSVGFDLELWRSVFSESNLRARRSLTLTEVNAVFKTEVETVKEKTTLDTKTLSSKLHAVLLSTKPRSPEHQLAEHQLAEHQLAAFVLDRLHKRLVPAGEFSGSSQSSLSGTVLKSLKQKAVQKLGQGSGAIVYKVAWLGAEVAVKTFYGQDDTDFIKEVSVLRGLFHPNIISFLGFAKDNRKRCIVMEKMDGDLHSLMQTKLGENESPFGILEGVDIMLQIGRGVHYLHELRIAHRDLKSGNILVRSVTSSESEIDYVRAKVADFGVSKTNVKSITDSIQTYNTGTTRWIAPELIKLSDSGSKKEKLEVEAMVKKYPLKCDMYSFAMVCYEILTGEHPFLNNASNTEIKNLVLKGVRPHLPKGCPDKLKRLIERCWSQDSRTRPSFGDICAELRHLKCLLLTPSVTMVDNSSLASSSRTSIGASSMTMADYSTINYLESRFECVDFDHRLSHPVSVEQSEAQNLLQLDCLCVTNREKVETRCVQCLLHPSRKVIRLGLPTFSAVSTAVDVAIADYSYVDYLKLSISSIDVVQELSKDQKVQLNPRQCEYLSDKLTETGCFLRAKSESLISIRDTADIRRKALLQLHFAVKLAEKLVRGCCCDRESLLDSAVTLSHIKEDIKDILLDLRWWTLMIDIAIALAKWMSSGQKIVLELLEFAERDYDKLLNDLHTSDNGLELAASQDEDLLLRKVLDVKASYADSVRTTEQNHDYLLAVHVRSRLKNSELETTEELNVYDDCRMIGQGGFGAVMDVRWLGRRCALKMLKQKCKKEATSLSEFQHPHIVQFFRYWEAPYVPTPQGTPQPTPQGTSRSDNSMQFHVPLQSHILMELLPMDLLQHLQNLRRIVNITAGSKRRPEHTRGSPIPEDVALDVMLQMVKAMWHLNSKDVAHRDLKPNNVLVRPVSDDEVPELNYRGYVRAKLADFGLAKTRALSSALSTQPALGTKVYGAPEVFNKDIISDKKYPRKADVWSFGIMFCEILSGKPPFPGVEDGTMTLGELQGRIKQGLRPQLPDNCPQYLKFIITSCWQLLPQDRPSFSDLLRLVRLAQIQSLGLIQKDHDLFTYTSRNGVRRLRPLKKSPAPAPESPVPSESLREELKESTGSSKWWIIPRIAFNLVRISASRSQPEEKPLGYLVNQMGPLNLGTSNSKLDVIFFEGNVGRRKDISCKDTWVQRNKPNVWWPRDWLPMDLGGDIRVLLLEYSISDDGVEGVLDQLQRRLVFSDRWNRRHTWERPIVLVGHSLGCVMIEHLVVALDRRARSLETVEDEVEIGRARVAQAFLTSLAGCFFYAPPWTGLVPSEDLLKHVFGGLSYSRELFSDLCLDSPKLKLLSEDFMRAQREHMKLTALIEGCHTRGRTVVPPASMQNFSGTFMELMDSSHTDVCKPTDKRHLAYKVLLDFVGEILENSKAIQNSSDD